MDIIGEFYLSCGGMVAEDAVSTWGTIMTCPDCEGFGFVVGELTGGRVKCLRCQGSGHVVRPDAAHPLDELEDLAISHPGQIPATPRTR